MVHLDWAHICHYFISDDQGRGSIISETDTICCDGFPCVYSRFYVVTRWSGIDGDFVKFKTVLRAPNSVDEIRSSDTTGMRISGGSLGVFRYDVTPFEQVAFTDAGIYTVEIYLDGTCIHVLELHVSDCDVVTV